jgi:hypothetical protein
MPALTIETVLQVFVFALVAGLGWSLGCNIMNRITKRI